MIKKILACITILVLAISIFAGCINLQEQDESGVKALSGTAVSGETSTEFKTNKDSITGRFPKLGDFQKCYWKGGVIGEVGRYAAPGPTPYWIKGFVVLNDADFQAYKKNYNWTAKESNWSPDLDTAVLGFDTFKWNYSEDFNRFIKPPSFFGKFYLDMEHGVIYFDVTK